ncbi:PH domain-containing protein [Clostridium sp. UBA7339]|uniref:PH domain-containing protein n=1 Tax=Clostridium sp. UBA7339 TaxID=1946376 RepID=UPI003217B859
MNSFNSNKKLEIIPTIFTFVMFNVIGVWSAYVIDSYLMLSLIRVMLVICNIFYLYHIGVWLTVKYEITNSEVRISALGGLKKVILPLSDVECYTVEKGKIRGISLSGISSNKFAIGRIAVKNLGTARMFVTSGSGVIYLKTQDISYAVSPKNSEKFLEILEGLGIEENTWTKKYNKVSRLHKDKKFMYPLILTSTIILFTTFFPMVLYILNKLPDVMPLVINVSKEAGEVGTDKQFAFAQMLYGLLNMAVMFCMYYAAHFCAKYDKKSAYRYIYISLLVAIVFLYIQMRLIMSVI